MKHKRLNILGPEPVSLPEAKRQCFVTSLDEDELIERLIVAARDYAEKDIWRAITPGEYVSFSDAFPDEIEIPYPPLIRVNKIEYINTDGDLVEMDTSKYMVDDLSDPARIKPVSTWPSTKNRVYNAVRVTYKAGYLEEVVGDDNRNNCPMGIKQAILLMVKHFYDNPEAVVVSGGGITVHEVPKGVDDLLNQESQRVFA